MHSLQIRIDSAGDDAIKMLKTLEPEADDIMKKTQVKILNDLPGIYIEAEDAHVMRAALNSYLRWLEITENIRKDYGNSEE